METIRIETPHGKTLVGILQPAKTPQKLNDPRVRPNLAIICHDLLGHKNQAFLPFLADNLPFDTFRFDFRGNGESDGETRFANFEKEIEDLFEVVHHFQNEGYHIYALIGYGKSTAVNLKYATYLNRAVPHIVNISPRYNMSEIWDTFQGPDLASLNSCGYVNLTSKGYNDKDVTLRVTKQDVETYANWDMAFVGQLTITTSVLTCHGLADTRTPVQNAALLANNIPTHTLQLLPSADHTFSNPQHAAQLVDTIVRYFSREGEKERSWRNGTGRSIQIPRWISVDGYRNFRDLGGWPVKGWDGSTVGYVRERLVFRGGDVSDITDEGVKSLRNLNIRNIFDFRSEPEVERAGGIRDIAGISRIHVPIFRSEDWSPAAQTAKLNQYFDGPEGYGRAYQEIIKSGAPFFRTIFLHIIDHPFSPLLVHCTAGKDRTGVFSMLLLSLCGVEDDVICVEYELTERTAFVEEDRIEDTSKVLKKSVDEIRSAMSARAESMRCTIHLFRETYGSVENYLMDECEMTLEEVEELREVLVVSVGFKENELYQPRR